jgi:hypothetical protein
MIDPDLTDKTQLPDRNASGDGVSDTPQNAIGSMGAASEIPPSPAPEQGLPGMLSAVNAAVLALNATGEPTDAAAAVRLQAMVSAPPIGEDEGDMPDGNTLMDQLDNWIASF